MTNNGLPRVTFGIIVLNGEPFTAYCLRALYPFAHQIIVVEGGHEATRSVTTPDGHSIDGTLETLRRFKEEEDPEGKLTIVTRDSFWPWKDEFGHDRTPQSQQYAQRATGDYLWQVDIDEFYLPEDMRAVLELLAADPSITAVSFLQHTFWGRPQYRCGGWYQWRGADVYHRLFKWGAGYRYVTHQPPTVHDEKGRDLRGLHWVRPEETARHGIRLYHYSLLFPWQVTQKTRIYHDEKPDMYADVLEWAQESYFRLGRPYRVHNLYAHPSWLDRWNGPVPPQVKRMLDDVSSGRVTAELRQVDDVERLLGLWWYPIGRFALMAMAPVAVQAEHTRSWLASHLPIPRFLRRSYRAEMRDRHAAR